MANKYDQPNARQKANDRAKAIAAKVFTDPAWKDIMKAVDPPPILEPHFTDACKAAGLKMGEIRWLKKYLEQCDAAVYGDDEVAATGW